MSGCARCSGTGEVIGERYFTPCECAGPRVLRESNPPNASELDHLDPRDVLVFNLEVFVELPQNAILHLLHIAEGGQP